MSTFFTFHILAYEHILQETSTELTELEASITNKTELVQKLQDEILDMTVISHYGSTEYWIPLSIE